MESYPEEPQTYNVIIDKITNIEEVMQIEDLNNVWSLIEIEDKRIASGNEAGHISIYS